MSGDLQAIDRSPPYTVREASTGVYHVLGRDGVTIIATCYRRGEAEALAAAPALRADLARVTEERDALVVKLGNIEAWNDEWSAVLALLSGYEGVDAEALVRAVLADLAREKARADRAEAEVERLRGQQGLTNDRLRRKRAEAARLKSTIEGKAWLPETGPLSLEDLRAIKARWTTGPERYQADADALIGEVDRLKAEVERLTKERDEAQGNYRFMVESAADAKLDGYRELGQRAATAENASDGLRAINAKLVERGEVYKGLLAKAAEAVKSPVVEWRCAAGHILWGGPLGEVDAAVYGSCCSRCDDEDTDGYGLYAVAPILLPEIKAALAAAGVEQP